MAIQNADLAPSEQCHVHERSTGAYATGVTNIVGMVPFGGQVVAGALKAFGLSGAPVYSLGLLRAAGGALTLIGLGATVTALDGGATLWQGISFTLGATALAQPGDLIVIQSGVANTAATNVHVSVVVKALQNVRSFYNVQIS